MTYKYLSVNFALLATAGYVLCCGWFSFKNLKTGSIRVDFENDIVTCFVWCDKLVKLSSAKYHTNNSNKRRIVFTIIVHNCLVQRFTISFISDSLIIMQNPWCNRVPKNTLFTHTDRANLTLRTLRDGTGSNWMHIFILNRLETQPTVN